MPGDRPPADTALPDEPAVKAVVLAVDEDPTDRATLEHELTKRYGLDYDVRTATSAAAALALLRRLRDEGTPVALVLADHWLGDLHGTALLDQVGALHPTAKRGLLVRWGDRALAEPILHAMAAGHVDYYLPKPAAEPDEGFHAEVESFLAEWAKVQGRGFTPVVAVGDPASPRLHELRDLLARNNLLYRVHPTDGPAGTALLGRSGLAGERRPVVFVLDRGPLVDPSNAALADAFGVNEASLSGRFDVAIVGAGPAGLGAAVGAASEGLRSLVIEREALGGQAGTSSLIRNFLGFPKGVSGGELAQRAYEQAWIFGAQFHLMHTAVALRPGTEDHTVVLSSGAEVVARSVVLAMGVRYRRLDVPTLDALTGAGVFYGAAVSEAASVASARVFIVGAGNSAGQAALHLAKYADDVTVLVRGAGLSETMSSYLVRHIAEAANVHVRTHVEVVDGGGVGRLEHLVLRDRRTGAVLREPADALFVLIGAEPHTDWLPERVRRDPWGFVLTGHDLLVAGQPPAGWPASRPPMLLESSVPGVFAAGDVRHRSLKRVASAVGEGATVITLVHEHLAPSRTD